MSDNQQGDRPASASAAGTPDRRGFLAGAATLGMGGGLALAYGTCGVLAARYLYPSAPPRSRWQFVVEVARMAPGASLNYRSPSGERIAIARGASSVEPGAAPDSAEGLGFIALSSTCPHLGCQVHWEAQKTRFFCPCHNGAFDPLGAPTAGPPADAGQSLPRHPLRVENGLLFLRARLEGVARLEGPPSDATERSG